MEKSSVKDRLVETASRLFYEQGYNRTGINQILEESGVAKASMYQKFRTKEELCVAYLQYMNRRFIHERDLYMNTPNTGVHPVIKLFDFLQAFFDKEGFRGCWCLNTVSEIPREEVAIMDEIRSQKNGFRSYIASLLPEIQSPEERTQRADMIYLLWEGAIAESQMHMESWPIKRAREMAIKLIE